MRPLGIAQSAGFEPTIGKFPLEWELLARINFFSPGEIPPDLNQMTKLQALFFTQKGSQAALEAHARCRWGPRPGRGLRQRRRGPQSSASWGRFPHWPQSGVLYSVCCRGSVPKAFCENEQICVPATSYISPKTTDRRTHVENSGTA